MRNFTFSLCELVKKSLVERQVAMDFAPNRDALLSMLKRHRHRRRRADQPTPNLAADGRSGIGKIESQVR